jgi:hypothetical protein
MLSASFWIDVGGQEVKATGPSAVQIGDRIRLVASMANGVD